MISGKRFLIVNGDDFGWTEGINRGIVQAHREGILTSATLLTCMPGSEHAVELANKNPSLGLGIHLSYTLGKIFPSTLAPGLYTLEGKPRFSVVGLWMAVAMSKKLREQLYRLFQYQIIWGKERGVEITHIDTHKHLHIWPVIVDLLGGLCLEFGIPAIRLPYESAWWELPHNWKTGIPLIFLSVFRPITKKIVSSYDLRMPDHFRGIIYTGLWTKSRFMRVLESLSDGVTEIMFHPGYSMGLHEMPTRLVSSREEEISILTDRSVLDYCRENDIELTNFELFK